MKETWPTWVDDHYELLLSRSTVLFRGNTEKASDFLHDLLLELRKKWDEIENPLAWISCTMRFRIVDYVSKQISLPRDNILSSPGPADPSLQIDIEKAILRLPTRLRKVLSLFLEGCSIQEIAQQTKLSPDAVYQRLSRARKKLKSFLGEKPHGKSM